MSMNISGLGNAYSGVNTNSKQYKALKEKGWLEGVIQNEAMMSPEGKILIYSSTTQASPMLVCCRICRTTSGLPL